MKLRGSLKKNKALAGLALGGLIFVAVGGAFAISSGAAKGSATQSQEDQWPKGAQDQFSTWIADYDPAEVSFLRDQAEKSEHASMRDDELVSVMEYRIACRTLNGALQAAQEATSPADRSAAVAQASDGMIARLLQRQTIQSDSYAAFDKEIGGLQAGDIETTQRFLNGNCARALSYK
jgi:hypothetical protein